MRKNEKARSLVALFCKRRKKDQIERHLWQDCEGKVARKDG